MDKKIIDEIFREEYDTFSKIYKSIAKREMPLITLDDLVEDSKGYG
ncbi:MAG: hypothetical protein ABIL03_01145 [candidate division WOR-3 bacterium]